jgi:hypothetical protein
MKNKILMPSALLVLSACAVSRVDPMSVPLLYTPNPQNAGAVGALACNAISQIQVSDARTDKTLGTRVHESLPLKAGVTTDSDAASWVQSGLQNLLTQNGITLQGNAPKLSVTLDSLHTTESIWHRSGYDASITLTGRLQSPSGKVCWNATVQGTGGNYGYSGSILNYQQTLNGALDAASVNLAQLQGFKEALCKCDN